MKSRVVLFGPPASGKGTQGQRVAKALGLGYLSTGALLRQEIAERTELGLRAEPILAVGGYLPDEWMGEILRKWLERNDEQGWVLDGFPRSLPQAEMLEQVLEQKGVALSRVVELQVSLDVLLERMRGRVECGKCHWTGQGVEICPVCGAGVARRSDDNEVTFRERYAMYEKYTAPLREFYGEKGVLMRVDAQGDIDDVFQKIMQFLQ